MARFCVKKQHKTTRQKCARSSVTCLWCVEEVHGIFGFSPDGENKWKAMANWLEHSVQSDAGQSNVLSKPPICSIVVKTMGKWYLKAICGLSTVFDWIRHRERFPALQNCAFNQILTYYCLSWWEVRFLKEESDSISFSLSQVYIKKASLSLSGCLN